MSKPTTALPRASNDSTQALPMPEAAPVTNATSPSKSRRSLLLFASKLTADCCSSDGRHGVLTTELDCTNGVGRLLKTDRRKSASSFEVPAATTPNGAPNTIRVAGFGVVSLTPIGKLVTARCAGNFSKYSLMAGREGWLE